MKKKILGFLIAMALSVPAYASIIVSPTKLEVNVNKIRNNYATCSIEVKGDPVKPMRFKAYSGYFTITDDAVMNMNPPKGDLYDASSRIRFVPSEFTVPPGKSQKVRVNIANVKNLPEGESRAVLYIEDVNVKEVDVPNSMGIGAQLILKTRVAVPIYIDKGKFVKSADIETFEIVKAKDGLYTKAKVVSTGNSKIRYTGKYQIIKGKKLIDEYLTEGRVVGVGNKYIAQDKIKTDKIKEAGDYKVRLILNYYDENDNKKSIKKEAILKITGEI